MYTMLAAAGGVGWFMMVSGWWAHGYSFCFPLTFISFSCSTFSLFSFPKDYFLFVLVGLVHGGSVLFTSLRTGTACLQLTHITNNFTWSDRSTRGSADTKEEVNSTGDEELLWLPPTTRRLSIYSTVGGGSFFWKLFQYDPHARPATITSSI